MTFELAAAQNFTACTAFTNRYYDKLPGPYFLLHAMQRVEEGVYISASPDPD